MVVISTHIALHVHINLSQPAATVNIYHCLNLSFSVVFAISCIDRNSTNFVKFKTKIQKEQECHLPATS